MTPGGSDVATCLMFILSETVQDFMCLYLKQAQTGKDFFSQWHSQYTAAALNSIHPLNKDPLGDLLQVIRLHLWYRLH